MAHPGHSVYFGAGRRGHATPGQGGWRRTPARQPARHTISRAVAATIPGYRRRRPERDRPGRHGEHRAGSGGLRLSRGNPAIRRQPRRHLPGRPGRRGDVRGTGRAAGRVPAAAVRLRGGTRHCGQYAKTGRAKTAGITIRAVWGEPHFRRHGGRITIPMSIPPVMAPSAGRASPAGAPSWRRRRATSRRPGGSLRPTAGQRPPGCSGPPAGSGRWPSPAGPGHASGRHRARRHRHRPERRQHRSPCRPTPDRFNATICPDQAVPYDGAAGLVPEMRLPPPPVRVQPPATGPPGSTSGTWVPASRRSG